MRILDVYEEDSDMMFLFFSFRLYLVPRQLDCPRGRTSAGGTVNNCNSGRHKQGRDDRCVITPCELQGLDG